MRPEGATAPVKASHRGVAFGWAALSAVGLLAGGIGPWTQVDRFQGFTDPYRSDGRIVLLIAIGGLIAVVLYARRQNLAAAAGALVAGFLGAGIAVGQLADVQSTIGTAGREAILAWGIYVSAVAGASLALASLMLLLRRQ